MTTSLASNPSFNSDPTVGCCQNPSCIQLSRLHSSSGSRLGRLTFTVRRPPSSKYCFQKFSLRFFDFSIQQFGSAHPFSAPRSFAVGYPGGWLSLDLFLCSVKRFGCPMRNQKTGFRSWPNLPFNSDPTVGCYRFPHAFGYHVSTRHPVHGWAG